MREIKYRQPLFKPNGVFFKFHYWGDTDGGFVSPVAGNAGRNSQEYTGLKDKNGKEIYDGDLIRYGETIYEVRWNFNKWIMFDKEFPEYNNFSQPIVGPSFSRNKMNQIEIIGNIYENKDLL